MIKYGTLNIYTYSGKKGKFYRLAKVGKTFAFVHIQKRIYNELPVLINEHNGKKFRQYVGNFFIDKDGVVHI